MKRPDTIHPVTCAVRYYTKTGNTKKLALAIAQALGVEALPISEPVSEAVDLLFLGNSYYAFSIDPEVRDFIRALDPKLVGKLVNFGSAAMLNSTWKKVAMDSCSLRFGTMTSRLPSIFPEISKKVEPDATPSAIPFILSPIE